MKIICIGRNYANHAKELNNPLPTEPLFFLKPETAVIRNNKPFYYPQFSTEIHHEIELILKINKPGKNIPLKFAHKYYTEIGLGIDFTARDLQEKCKLNATPWEIAKAFDGAAPIGKFIDKSELQNLNTIQFHLNINGNTIQKGNTADLIFSFDIIIAHISKYITLKTGDIIFTGTPAGVGPIKIGDLLEGFIEDVKMIEVAIR